MWSESSGKYSNLWPQRQHNSVPSYDGPDTHWRSLDLVFVLEQLRCDMALDIGINPFLWSGHFDCFLASWYHSTLRRTRSVRLTNASWLMVLVGLEKDIGGFPQDSGGHLAEIPVVNWNGCVPGVLHQFAPMWLFSMCQFWILIFWKPSGNEAHEEILQAFLEKGKNGSNWVQVNTHMRDEMVLR